MGRMLKIIAAVFTPLLLSACLLIPGKFDSHLKLMSDGSYVFSYNGQMQMISDGDKGLSPPSEPPFDPMRVKCSNRINNETGEIKTFNYPAFDDDDAKENTATDSPYRYENRACTAKETAGKKEKYDGRQARRKKENEEKSAVMSNIFGGAVPGNDDSLKKLAGRLAKYEGWNKVEYAGNNIFNVEYAVSGRFDQYFSFPTLPDATMQFPFVQIMARRGGDLEISTPAMGGPSGIFGALALNKMGAGNDLKIEPIDGRFTIETDGEILSNNSADGYSDEAGLKTIFWKVGEDAEIEGFPRAIIRLSK